MVYVTCTLDRHYPGPTFAFLGGQVTTEKGVVVALPCRTATGKLCAYSGGFLSSCAIIEMDNDLDCVLTDRKRKALRLGTLCSHCYVCFPQRATQIEKGMLVDLLCRTAVGSALHGARHEAICLSCVAFGARHHKEQEGQTLPGHLAAECPMLLYLVPVGCVALYSAAGQPITNFIVRPLAVGTKQREPTFAEKPIDLQQCLGMRYQVPEGTRHVHRAECAQHQERYHAAQVAALA